MSSSAIIHPIDFGELKPKASTGNSRKTSTNFATFFASMPVTTKVYCETQQDPSKGCATWQKFWRLSLHGLCLGRVPPTGGAKPMNIRFLYGRPPTFPSCVNEEIRGLSQSHQKWRSQWSLVISLQPYGSPWRYGLFWKNEYFVWMNIRDFKKMNDFFE